MKPDKYDVLVEDISKWISRNPQATDKDVWKEFVVNRKCNNNDVRTAIRDRKRPPRKRRSWRECQSKRRQLNFRPPQGTEEKFEAIDDYLRERNMSKSRNETLAVIVNDYYALIEEG